MLQGCGHSASDTGHYAETISWEEGEEIWPEELSDSELEAADDSAASDSASVDDGPDTADASDPAAGSDIRPATDTKAAASLSSASAGRLRLRNIGRLAEVFNDSNRFQLEHARRLGVEPMTGLSSYYNTRRPLVKIRTNSDFVVDELRHSYPFLVPEAVRLLHDIGRNFQDSLKSRGGGRYRIIVTSVLRTPSTVKKLKRVNGNATQESTHQYGTTFDITYSRFDPIDGKEVNTQGDLKNLLAEVIYDLHRRGRCMVKYERKSPCFHITVVE